MAELPAESVAEIQRLRTLIIQVADDLGLVEKALVAVCQDATDDNIDQRCALMELRTLIAKLKGSGRSHKPNCSCPHPAEWAYCQDTHPDAAGVLEHEHIWSSETYRHCLACDAVQHSDGSLADIESTDE